MEEMGVDLSSYGQEGDAAVVVGVGGGAFTFVQSGNVGLVPGVR